MSIYSDFYRINMDSSRYINGISTFFQFSSVFVFFFVHYNGHCELEDVFILFFYFFRICNFLSKKA